LIRPESLPLVSIAYLAINLLGSTALPGTLNEPGLPVRAPFEVGMSRERLATVDRIVLKGLESGGYPGAALVVGRRGYSVVQKGYGQLSYDPLSPFVSPENTVYDVASLTKVVGTTTAIMILFDDGKIRLSDPVSKFLPEFRTGDKAQITVKHLLLHTSGLPAGKELWRLAKTPAQARSVVLQSKLFCKPGSCFNYSDLGPDVLGFIVEKITQKKLDRFLSERVFEPLGMTNTLFKPPASMRARTAPTEVKPPRGRPLQGEVHDESAWALGGVAGHAGLFSTADDLSVFAQMMLNRGTFGGVRIVSDSAIELFTTRAGGTRALGWDTANGEFGAGQFLSSRAFGHTGYTGTSLWIDPERDLFVVLLTNRVHAPRVRQPGYLIADIRNDLMDAVVLSVTDTPLGLMPMLDTFRSDTASYWNARVVKKGTRQ
jgi:CubicO group peptidase (beta-lactamase class C family)